MRYTVTTFDGVEHETTARINLAISNGNGWTLYPKRTRRSAEAAAQRFRDCTVGYGVEVVEAVLMEAK